MASSIMVRWGVLQQSPKVTRNRSSVSRSTAVMKSLRMRELGIKDLMIRVSSGFDGRQGIGADMEGTFPVRNVSVRHHIQEKGLEFGRCWNIESLGIKV